MNQQGDFIIMKLVKTASGKIKIKMSKSEWKSIGKKAGWSALDEADFEKREAPKTLYGDLDCYDCGKLIGDEDGGKADDEGSILCKGCYENRKKSQRGKKNE